MSRRDGSINYSEHRVFQEQVSGVDGDAILREATTPTDGWDPTPRPSSLEPGDDAPRHGELDIPLGHIAFQGDFDKPDRSVPDN